MMMGTKRPVDGQRGFSLVELMIAMVVLAIGILATMAMQYTALAGYTSAREVTGATEVARTVEQIIHAEAQGVDLGESPLNIGSAYDTADEGFLEAALNGGGDWVRPSGLDEPMSLGMSTTGDAAQRFCVYVAGEMIDEDGNVVTAGQGDPVFARVSIAVVYPASNATFPNATHNNPGDCVAPTDGLGDHTSGGLQNYIEAGNTTDLELDGFRVTHLSTGVGAQNVGTQ